MPLPNLRRPKAFLLVAAPAVMLVATLRTPQPAPAAPPPEAVLAFPPTLTPSAVPPTPTAIPPTATTAPPVATSAPDANATPTPRTGAVKVGIQIGHWKSNELPDELQRLRTSTGTAAGGVTELGVNLDIGQRVADLLRQRGIEVDVLPATVPPGYVADAFVAIHADGSPNTKARGFKLATPWRTSPAAQHLLEAITATYYESTKLPRDGSITMNMRGYYAFSWRRHEHAVAKTTPSVIVEMGFLTNPSDRALLTKNQNTVAVGIANGIIRYLNERDPNDGAALLPPDFKTQKAATSEGVIVRASPSDKAKILLRAGEDKRLFPIQAKDGWLQVIVRDGGGIVGWVRRDQVVETNEPQPTPPPATDT